MRDEILSEIVFQVLRSRLQDDGHSAKSMNADQIKCLLKQIQSTFQDEPILLRLEGPIYIIGDIHGDLFTLTRLLNHFGYPPSSRYLFLGDYVDRGDFSCEVLILLYALKLLFPDHIYLLRGNHESKLRKCNSNFHAYCEEVFSPEMYKLFLRTFAFMPLAAVISSSDQNVFCVHGGISPHLTTLESIESITKPVKSLNQVSDLLWSDPSINVDLFQDSPRGVGYLFGPRALSSFLSDNNLTAIVRGHETCHRGFLHNFGSDFPLTTVFSSANYCNKGNEAAIVFFGKDGSITPFTIPPEPKCLAYPEFLIPSFEKEAYFLPDDDFRIPFDFVPI